MAQQGGDRVVVFEPEAVPAAAGDDLQSVSGVQQGPVGRVDLPVRAVGQPRGGQRAQH